MDNLWTKGEKSLQQLQQQHLETMSRFEGQLSACQDAQHQPEVENATIRDLLERLCTRLANVFEHMEIPDVASALSETSGVQLTTPARQQPDSGGAGTDTRTGHARNAREHDAVCASGKEDTAAEL